MREAMVQGERVAASPAAPKAATCPECGHRVTLRQRLGTWHWRHWHGAPRDCPARFNAHSNGKVRATTGDGGEAVTDPVLQQAHDDNLDEIGAMLEEAGAEGAWVLRGVRDVRVSFVPAGAEGPIVLRMARGRAFLVARFPEGDGERPGIVER